MLTAEDYDLGSRASMNGKVIHVHDFTVTHYGEANTIAKKIKKERWYAQNMFDLIRKNHFYKPFWITVLFMLSFFVFIVSLLFMDIRIALFGLVFTVLISFIMALYLCQRATSYDYFFLLIPISYAYLVGRSIGVLDVLAKEILNKFD
jgi:hypothetical protein